MWAFSLLQRTYNLNEKQTKKVSIYLDDNLRPQVKIEAPKGRAVLNYTQWFILVTFKDNIPKGEVHELGDSAHTLSVHCGRYVRIATKNIQVLLSKKEWTYLMELASACINRQVIRFSRLQDDLVPWWNKCLQERAFSTPPDANGIDFDSLYDELSHRASLFNKNNPDPDSDSDTMPYNA